MRTLKVSFVAILFTFFSVAGQAQSQQNTKVGQLVSGLITANVGAIAVNVDDITVEDLVDVNNVLNNNDIDILNNVLNNSPIASNNSEILTNLLQDAKILTDNQIVVGVLSRSGDIVYHTIQ